MPPLQNDIDTNNSSCYITNYSNRSIGKYQPFPPDITRTLSYGKLHPHQDNNDKKKEQVFHVCHKRGLKYNRLLSQMMYIVSPHYSCHHKSVKVLEINMKIKNLLVSIINVF